MATGFSTRSGPDGYRLNFDTDNLDYYLLMQKIARYCVDGKPAADVVEVRHGHWIGEIDDRDGHIWMECSECHKIRIVDDFCGACGARMEKEDEHETG